MTRPRPRLEVEFCAFWMGFHLSRFSYTAPGWTLRLGFVVLDYYRPEPKLPELDP